MLCSIPPPPPQTFMHQRLHLCCEIFYLLQQAGAAWQVKDAGLQLGTVLTRPGQSRLTGNRLTALSYQQGLQVRNLRRLAKQQVTAVLLHPRILAKQCVVLGNQLFQIDIVRSCVHRNPKVLGPGAIGSQPCAKCDDTDRRSAALTEVSMTECPHRAGPRQGQCHLI